MQIDHDGARKAIRGLVYSIEGYRQRMRQDTAPAENSIAERQIDQEQHKLVASWSATPVQLSFATAEEHIGHAQDHLLVLQRLLPPPFQSVPNMHTRAKRIGSVRPSLVVARSFDLGPQARSTNYDRPSCGASSC